MNLKEAIQENDFPIPGEHALNREGQSPITPEYPHRNLGSVSSQRDTILGIEKHDTPPVNNGETPDELRKKSLDFITKQSAYTWLRDKNVDRMGSLDALVQMAYAHGVADGAQIERQGI